MDEIDKVRLYQELLALDEKLGRVLELTAENVRICKETNRDLAIGRLKIDAARAAYEKRTLA